MRTFLSGLFLLSSIVHATTVIPSTWMGHVKSHMPGEIHISVVEPTQEHPYSYIVSNEKNCRLFSVQMDGKDATWGMVKTPAPDIPVYNALIAMHEIGHCAMMQQKKQLMKKELWVETRTVLEKKTWISSKEIELTEWYDEHFADMYSLLWLSHMVDERDFWVISDYLLTLRDNNRADGEHNTYAMVKAARNNYWQWRNVPVDRFVLTAAVESLQAIQDIIEREEWQFKANT